MTTLADTDVLILAGGHGIRSRAYLGDVPKFLTLIDGLPLAAHLLPYLHTQGVRRVVLALSGSEGGAEQILDWLKREKTIAYDLNLRIDLDILTSVEPEPRGITSAIVAARPHLLSNPVIIINGDTLLDLDLAMVLSRYLAIKQTMRVVSQLGISTGCVIVSRKLLAHDYNFKNLYNLGFGMTTSRDWLDIGTPDGYAAAHKWVAGQRRRGNTP